MDRSKKGFLPMLPRTTLSRTQCPTMAKQQERMSGIHYALALRSIMHAILCTRPDVSHAVSLTSRYQSYPGEEH